ncbi:acyl dehydratase [Dermabacter sp. p3-SID358]|uniref:MaoC/PaaZ C-terminal domain-containing protein n=1 Tax=Dermabacter sp. p3-SID358 TaxID=2916114 RepID=UPI0021A897D8|nr:MaoC/PaaZ C-terminal domain-containing protein [Dermabacter sp. p3-SID358]MCT1866684.1 acyl dehydratase [Dermabacter sp. p3-SID358]
MTTPTVPTLGSLTKGDVIARETRTFTRDTLVRYAGASGDFNPIHYNDAFAAEVGLPSVIAHGMLTMGAVISPVLDWLGDPGRLVSYETRFTRPIEVPALDGVDVDIEATVGLLKTEDGTARIDITASVGGQKVLTKCRAVVRLA